MEPYCYSPLPIEEYRIISMPICEASAIMQLGDTDTQSVWNLFWLSIPAVDVLPVYGKKKSWFKHYAVVDGAMRAIVADAVADEALARKLRMHPSRFIEFFEREDHSIHDCYEALGGARWVRTVLERAERARRRMSGVVLPDLGTARSGYDMVMSLFLQPKKKAT